MAFDGKLSPTSADAAIYELFLQESTKQIFLDELGPESSPAWKAFIANGDLSYAAQADHLLGREDSPFWDDVRTPQKEDKPQILARSLAAAISAGDSQLGGDHKAWQWGKLHSYTWKNANGQTVRGPWRPAAITPRSTPRRLPGARTSTPRGRRRCVSSSTSARPNP
jgi:acyl-homoserine-lactone acylase